MLYEGCREGGNRESEVDDSMLLANSFLGDLAQSASMNTNERPLGDSLKLASYGMVSSSFFTIYQGRLRDKQFRLALDLRCERTECGILEAASIDKPVFSESNKL